MCALLKFFVLIWVLGFQAKHDLLNEYFQVLVFLGFVDCGTDACVNMDMLGWSVEW